MFKIFFLTVLLSCGFYNSLQAEEVPEIDVHVEICEGRFIYVMIDGNMVPIYITSC